ncbi:hypothetical protein [Helicobacter cetorum]|uniref:hypothetical protein n=1 Tax=Helicobacter cetorum TaxID=138563 RepID=UPI000CF1AAD5|nr:hypothetical protein [Helicobacter cetorum]
MKRLICSAIVIMALQVAWARELPTWAKSCPNKPQIKHEIILSCGMSEALSLDMDYSLSLARHNALEKIINTHNSDRLEIKASKIKATFIGASKVFVLIEVDSKNIQLIQEKKE